MNKAPQCAMCPYSTAEKICTQEKGKGPDNCPTLIYHILARETLENMPAAEREFELQSLRQGGAGYQTGASGATPVKTRLVEIVEFSQRMAYKRLGLIFCGSASREGRIVSEILANNGFEVVSVICKVGRVPKAHFGITPDEQINRNKAEVACNPVLQARLINEAGVDFNILINLCVGHDSLVIKHLDAPVTVLSVKDRVLNHNPLAAIYLYESCATFLKKPLI